MTSTAEAGKKRNSFSLLSSKSATSKLDSEETLNGRFIPESKRGWKYDAPYTQTGSSLSVKQAQPSPPALLKTTSTTTPQLDSSSSDPPASRAVLSAPLSPKNRSIALKPAAAAPPEAVSSDSSSSDDEPEPSPPGLPLSAPLDEAGPASRDNGGGGSASGADARRHPDDLVYPETYPWKPSRKNPKAKYIHPAHRNPTAKQAFYDTHFGSSSNYRGFLPASGSLLSLSTNKVDMRRRSSDNRTDATAGLSTENAEGDAHTKALISTVKKPFATASKLLTKARRKSFGAWPISHIDTEDDNEAPQNLKRPHPVPLYDGAADGLAAQQSGFSYGLSMEDAAQVEAVVSRHASREDITTPVRLEEQFSPPASQEASSFRWREAMHSAWGFLPSFDFFASFSGPTEDDKEITASPSVNILEPEAIPTVKKDAGNPDYFKNLSGNVVLMGGYRGSVLRDAETSMMMWIPIKVGVGLRRPTLELGLSTEAEEKSEDLVYSNEMCTSIGKLVDMGKRLEERIAGRRHAKVYVWGYDWRLSLARSSRRLISFLEELYDGSADARTGTKRGAKVVAHSMGGLVALHALATCSNPRIFEGLVFASTPFLGTPNILGPFRFGDAALFNDTICSPRATFSFRSSFYLLPTDGRCFEVPVGDPEQDEENLSEQQRKQRFKDVDFLDPDIWNELGLSPCLQMGRRKQMIALARRDVASGEEGQASTNADENEPSRAAQNDSTGSDLDVASPQGEESGKPNGLTMGVVEGLADGSNPLATDSKLPADTQEQRGLQPENRQGAQRNASAELDFDRLDYATQSWLYLERTLSEVRQFWSDIERGFDESKLHEYPPLMLLTSGRTPSVRGALVGVDQAGQWKDDVRAGDYSRMTYGAGDGVITRRSATTLPGPWSRLLASRSETEQLPERFHGRGPPFKPSAGKARLKLDRYPMHFDGEGIVESSHRHVTLLSDVDGIGKCLEAVRRANLVRGRLTLSDGNEA
ncbi:hypothetical protein EX895_004934 [Sporisorium graminicola]|uniref:Uncharacterized protein n=1 Tax=Sporisorium graminicola TaxID=280036 RepID=A0A4V6EV39_9BASI|nr:hypothetical protein EX895_004934 [Sporisorium graminicola]TKY86109.1 hypothetical protein EX895_004934 [Sporisorium graminicola]